MLARFNPDPTRYTQTESNNSATLNPNTAEIRPRPRTSKPKSTTGKSPTQQEATEKCDEEQQNPRRRAARREPHYVPRPRRCSGVCRCWRRSGSARRAPLHRRCARWPGARRRRAAPRAPRGSPCGSKGISARASRSLRSPPPPASATGTAASPPRASPRLRAWASASPSDCGGGHVLLRGQGRRLRHGSPSQPESDHLGCSRLGLGVACRLASSAGFGPHPSACGRGKRNGFGVSFARSALKPILFLFFVCACIYISPSFSLSSVWLFFCQGLLL